MFVAAFSLTCCIADCFLKLSFAASGEDDTGGANSEGKPSDSKKRRRGDDSSSLSSDAKNLLANDNLDRNVRWHNQRMMKGSLNDDTDNGPKDDVTGASVTANNASARLSSLKHVPENKKDVKSAGYENGGDQSSSDDSLLAGVEEKKKGENASDDSGYRESNDSREETSSSGSDTSQSNGKEQFDVTMFCVQAAGIFSYCAMLLFRSPSKASSDMPYVPHPR